MLHLYSRFNSFSAAVALSIDMAVEMRKAQSPLSRGFAPQGHEMEALFLNECANGVAEATAAARRADAVVSQLRRSLEGLPVRCLH